MVCYNSLHWISCVAWMYLVTCTRIFTFSTSVWNFVLFSKVSIGTHEFSYNPHVGFINSVLGL